MSNKTFDDLMNSLFELFLIVGHSRRLDINTTDDGQIKMTSLEISVVITIDEAKILSTGLHATDKTLGSSPFTSGLDRCIDELNN